MYGRNLTLCTLIAAALGYASNGQQNRVSPQRLDGKIKWVYTYQEGKQIARRTGKPLFVVFRCER